MRTRLSFSPRPCLTVGERQVTRLRSQQCWRLLRLLAEAGSWSERDALALELWPNMDSKKARHNLRQCLLYIRQAVPESKVWLLCEGERLKLDSGGIDIDLRPAEDETVESEPLVMPRLASVFSRMDEASRLAAVVAMTPAWITTGCHSEGIDEIDKLRRSPIGARNPELILCEAELNNASYRITQSVAALDQLRVLNPPLSDSLKTRYFLSRGLTMARLDANDEAALRHALSAYRSARSNGNRTLALRALQVAAVCLIENGREQDARRVIAKALRMAGDRPETPWRAPFYHLLTRLELILDNRFAADEASARGVSALAGHEQPGLHGILPARLGRLREAIGDHQGAIKLYQQSQELLAETECAQEAAEVHTYLGDVYRLTGDYQKSLSSHERAVSLRRTLRTPDALGTSLRGAGMAAQGLGDHRTAIKCLSESALLFEGCGRGIGKASALIPLSRSYAALDRVNEALPMFEQSLQFLDGALVGSRRLQLPRDLSATDEMKVEFAMMARRTRPTRQISAGSR